MFKNFIGQNCRRTDDDIKKNIEIYFLQVKVAYSTDREHF